MFEFLIQQGLKLVPWCFQRKLKKLTSGYAFTKIGSWRLESKRLLFSLFSRHNRMLTEALMRTRSFKLKLHSVLSLTVLMGLERVVLPHPSNSFRNWHITIIHTDIHTYILTYYNNIDIAQPYLYTWDAYLAQRKFEVSLVWLLIQLNVWYIRE